MKAFLRILITAAIVVAIVLGVRALVGDKRTEAYVFDNLEWKEEYSSTGIDQNLSDFYEFKGANVDKFNEEGYNLVTTSLDSGEYYKVNTLYQKAEAVFNTLKTQSALATKITKGLQTDVIDSYKTFIKAVQTEKDACASLTRLINANASTSDSFVNAADLNDSFNRVTSEYKSVLKALIDLNESLRIYVLSDVYDGKLASFEDIKTSLTVEMMKAYSKNNNLENDMDIMMNSFDVLDDMTKTELVINYSNIKSISEFLNAENKTSYIENASDSLKNVAKILFGIEA